MGASGDLTILANVKAWRDPPITNTIDDAQISRAITATSKAILAYLQRCLICRPYTEVRNGIGGNVMLLEQYPPNDDDGWVLDLTSLTIGLTSIAQAPNAASTGWILDARTGAVYLRGYAYWRGVQNVSVSYTAGYLVENEAQEVASGMLQCAALSQLWSADNGVTYADGTALIAVASNPAAGQYVSPAAPDGFYIFNAGDDGADILVSYSFTPRNVEQACIEMVIKSINERNRIGQNAKSLAGENVTFFVQKAMTESVKQMLQPYRRLTPI